MPAGYLACPPRWKSLDASRCSADMGVQAHLESRVVADHEAGFVAAIEVAGRNTRRPLHVQRRSHNNEQSNRERKQP